MTEVADGGSDRVLASVNWTLGAHVETLVLTGTANIDGTGNELANVLTGNAGNNVLMQARAPTRWRAAWATTPEVVDVAGDVVTEGVGQGTDTINAWLGWLVRPSSTRGCWERPTSIYRQQPEQRLFGNSGKNL